jgi:hypothetical protein
MPTILDLFKKQENDLYDGEKTRIESRGLVNPPRAAALVASSPNAIGDLIGGQIAGIVGGTANRPSDTIYGSNNFTAKPISIKGATTALLQNSVQAGENYYVKQNPSPASVLRQLSQGGTSASGVITNLAIEGINKIGSKKPVNTLSKQLKENNPSTYGPKYAIGANGKPLQKEILNSTYKETYSQIVNDKTGRREYISTELVKREGKFKWDDGNSFLLNRDSFKDETEYTNEFQAKYKDTNQIPILFKKYGNNTIIPFVGAISGISEDVSPEWTGFQYVGSPFKNYRYSGVERSLKFNLKLYYFELSERTTMIKKVNYLKSLAFPYDKISEITYGTDKASNQYAFSPNLVYLTIGDMYKNVFGFIESLSFNIEDNTSWSNFDNGGSNDKSAYPSIIDVSIGMKIIENHQSNANNGTITYKYNFDGRDDKFIEETRKSDSQPANSK